MGHQDQSESQEELVLLDLKDLLVLQAIQVHLDSMDLLEIRVITILMHIELDFR